VDKMIPKTRAYESSKVTPPHSRAEVEDLLSKFNITKTMWKRDDPQSSYFVFEKPYDGVKQAIAYKVGLPFIEKKTRSGKKEFDEVRSYRFFFHIFKAAMLNFDIGMEFEQIFGNFMVVSKALDGTPLSVQDKIGIALVQGKSPALELASQ